jgi:hypothetical protein
MELLMGFAAPALNRRQIIRKRGAIRSYRQAEQRAEAKRAAEVFEQDQRKAAERVVREAAERLAAARRTAEPKLSKGYGQPGK